MRHRRTPPRLSRTSRTHRSRPTRPSRRRQRPNAVADDATDEAEQADAQVDQANAERDAAQAKARIAAECGKAYVSAFGGLFGSGSVREQVPDVRKALEGITADCRTAFAGT